MKLFVDSSGWIGLFSDADKYHQLASEAFRNLQAQPVQLFTSDYVIDETLTHLLYVFGHQYAVRFGDWVMTNANVAILHVDVPTWHSAWEMFKAYDDKVWAFTDCTSFVLMRQEGLYRAFTFDHHFAQAGFQLWPEQ